MKYLLMCLCIFICNTALYCNEADQIENLYNLGFSKDSLEYGYDTYSIVNKEKPKIKIIHDYHDAVKFIEADTAYLVPKKFRNFDFEVNKIHFVPLINESFLSFRFNLVHPIDPYSNFGFKFYNDFKGKSWTLIPSYKARLSKGKDWMLSTMVEFVKNKFHKDFIGQTNIKLLYSRKYIPLDATFVAEIRGNDIFLSAGQIKELTEGLFFINELWFTPGGEINFYDNISLRYNLKRNENFNRAFIDLKIIDVSQEYYKSFVGVSFTTIY